MRDLFYMRRDSILSPSWYGGYIDYGHRGIRVYCIDNDRWDKFSTIVSCYGIDGAKTCGIFGTTL